MLGENSEPKGWRHLQEQPNLRAQSIQASNTPLPVTLENGQVRVHLPFAVDPQLLSEQLQREGYPLAHEPNTPDTQGWGPDFDPNGYYPYWVYPDPADATRSVFAFNPQPEDVVQQGSRESLSLGEQSRELINRWVPLLAGLRSDEADIEE